MVSVYWIRHVDHTDMFSQGYIGISKNTEQRFKNHVRQPTNVHMKNAINKYGWDNLVKQIILIADNEYCLDIEKKLRPVDFIGWNATAGGGMPPRPKKGMGKGNKLSQETKDKISAIRKGCKHSMETRQKLSQMAKDQWAKYHANGNKHTPEPAENN